MTWKPTVAHNSGRLTEAHREHLRGSGLTDETIELAKIRSESNPKKISSYYKRKWSKDDGGGMEFPYFAPGQGRAIVRRFRPDRPPPKGPKYISPKGAGMKPYLPPRSVADGRLRDRSQVLYFTEGEKKTLALDQEGYAVVGGSGVDGFHDTTAETRILHPLIREHALIKGRVCRIAFDHDALASRGLPDRERASKVWGAAERLAGMLVEAGAADVRVVVTPKVNGDGKAGWDDLLAAEGPDALKIALTAEGYHVEPAPTAKDLEPFRPQLGWDFPEVEGLRVPRGFRLGPKGWVERPSGGSESNFFAQFPPIPLRLHTNPETGAEQVEVAIMRMGKWVSRVIDRADLYSRNKIGPILGGFGVNVDPDQMPDVARWLAAMLRTNEAHLPKVSLAEGTGWQDGRTFMLGAECITSGDPSESFRLHNPTAERWVGGIRSEGSLEVQRELLRELVRPEYAAGASLILGAVAAPLLRELGHTGAAIHLHGQSSRGKSTMLQVAASVFGCPRLDDARPFVGTWDATTNALELRAAAGSDLPLCLDEAGLMEAQARQKVVYSIAGGQGRSRANRNAELRKARAWRTVLLSTGEVPVNEADARTGAMVRTLQPTFNGLGELGAREVEGIRDRAFANFGHIGRELVRRLTSLDDAARDQMRATYRAKHEELRGLAHGGALAQRQAGLLASLAVAEVVLARWFDIGSEASPVARRLVSDRALLPTVLPEDERARLVLGDRIASNHHRYPRLKTDLSSGRKWVQQTVTTELEGYVDPEDEVVHFIPSALRKVLSTEGLSLDPVLRSFRARGGVRFNEVGRSSQKKQIDGRRQRLITINLAFIEGESTSPNGEGAPLGEGGCPAQMGGCPAQNRQKTS